MPRETQKEKIERLEKVIDDYKKQLDTALRKLYHCQEEIKVKKSDLEDVEMRERAKDEIIRELYAEIHKLKNENEKLRTKNVRGAGRLPKFTEWEVLEILELREKGRTITSLAQEFKCSVGLIHKLINEHKEGIL